MSILDKLHTLDDVVNSSTKAAKGFYSMWCNNLNKYIKCAPNLLFCESVFLFTFSSGGPAPGAPDVRTWLSMWLYLW